MDALLHFGGSACSALLPPRGERAQPPPRAASAWRGARWRAHAL